MLPNFLIIGAMRSGTTWLAHCLGEHPDVFMAAKKEVHYFDAVPDRSPAWYERHFDTAGEAPAIGEATPRYMYDPLSVERIADQLPNVRLIAILRNPVDRTYSHYWLNRSRGVESLNFGAALEAEPARLLRDRRSRFRYSYVDRGRYGAQLSSLMGRFRRSQIHACLLSDFSEDPQREFASICRFLGIRDDVLVPSLGVRMNRYHQFRSLGIRRLGRQIPREGLGRVIRNAIGRMNRVEASYPPMPSEVRQWLRTSFSEDAEVLGRWLGRDLASWVR